MPKIRLYADYPYTAGGAYLTFLAAQTRPRNPERVANADRIGEVIDALKVCQRQCEATGDAAFMAPYELIRWVMDYDAGESDPPPPQAVQEFCRAVAQMKAEVDYVFI